MVEPIVISAIAAGIATSMSVFVGIRDLIAKHSGKQHVSNSLTEEQRASVLVEMPDGKQTKIEISQEEANRLIHRHVATTSSIS